MPPENGNADEVTLDAGILYVAPVGSVEPLLADDAAPSAAREIGYTESGSTVTITRTSQGIEVAEEEEDIKTVNVKRATTVAFQMAQATRRNLALALNVGANESNTGAIEPGSADTEVPVMLLWKSDDEYDPRWHIFRRCRNTGNVEWTNNKAPNKKLIPVTFSLEKPPGAAPWKIIPNADGLI